MKLKARNFALFLLILLIGCKKENQTYLPESDLFQDLSHQK